MPELTPPKLVPNWMEVCELNEWQTGRVLGDYDDSHAINLDNFNIVADYLVGEAGVLPENLQSWFFRPSLTDGGVEMLPVDILQEENGFGRVVAMAEKQLQTRLERVDLSPEQAQEETVMRLRPRTLQSVNRIIGMFDKAFSDNGLRFSNKASTCATLLDADDTGAIELRLINTGHIKEYRTITRNDHYRDMLSIMFVEGALAKTALFTSMDPTIEIPDFEIIEPSDFSAPPSISDIEYIGALVRRLSSDGKLELVGN